MKVLVEYTETGMYKDYSWGNPTMRTKGQLHAVEPASAATLIKAHKACLYKNEDGEIVIQR
ncbi:MULTISPECIES: hypothetical protein [Vibrio]|uniref:Uncharacterized protein n=1 Tax=Vibrio casei TaxID=673372 RepID=A0A368LI47_9VIBR|nr:MULTISPECIES: hypothetical protein [Vibrio]RCS70414.1 hypothetical protein CIK83_13335 [Vibrio casei]SJN20770.1 hypothetical protein FM109_03290 [Vibrio casei]HBV77034.1 hypothetical protein [Vibrio sp.]